MWKCAAVVSSINTGSVDVWRNVSCTESDCCGFGFQEIRLATK